MIPEVLKDYVDEKVALEAGNAAGYTLKLQHPALKECQQELEEHLDPVSELLDSLVSNGFLTFDEKRGIVQDPTREGRAKRIILKADRSAPEGPKKLANNLQGSTHANKLLGVKLAACFDKS